MEESREKLCPPNFGSESPNKKNNDRENATQIYSYNNSDLLFTRVPWPPNNDFVKSKFDQLLCTKWDKAMEDGHFWYVLDNVKRKKLDGPLGLIAQLNTKRFSQRRKPAEMTCVKMPFDENHFNFTKVKKHEVLFAINPVATKSSKSKGNQNLVIINVSPIDYGHVLLVPDATAHLPQVVTLDSMKLAIEICLLSTHRGLRIGFNSLCAFASVNHLHFHVLYVDNELPLDRADVSFCCPGLFELHNYFVRGFALQLENQDSTLLSRRVEKITSYFSENEIPYNMFMCRSEKFAQYDASCLNCSNDGVMRVFIFPKYSAPGFKDTKYLNSCCFDVAGYLLLKVSTDFPFNSAALELCGFLPIRDEQEFEKMGETQAMEILNKYTYREDEFSELKHKLTYLFETSFQNE